MDGLSLHAAARPPGPAQQPSGIARLAFNPTCKIAEGQDRGDGGYVCRTDERQAQPPLHPEEPERTGDRRTDSVRGKLLRIAGGLRPPA